MVAKRTEVRLELLLGRRVRDARGRVIGRLEEFRATHEGEAWVVTEFEIGPTALLDRLAIRHLPWIRGRRPAGYRARWDQIDITEAEAPRLTVPLEDLERLQP